MPRSHRDEQRRDVGVLDDDLLRRWASFAHAATGERLGRRCGHLGFLARELIDEVGAVMRTAVAPSDDYGARCATS